MIVADQSTPTQHRYSVIVTYDPESGTYLADVPALGFQTYGFTSEHAFEMAAEAIAGRLEVMIELGEPIPIEEHRPEVREVAV